MANFSYNGVDYDISEKYSNRDMTGWNISSAEDMDGIVIVNSCLASQDLSAQVLPANLTGATFIRCNLDNVFIPDGNTVIDCSNRFIAEQNDGEDWLIDPQTLAPIEPVNKKLLEMNGQNTDPALIPAERVAE